MTIFIYKASFSNNPKVYIGQTIDFRRRVGRHKNDAKNGCSFHIHRAMRKYGIENAIFEVIATCLEDTTVCGDLCEIAMIAQYDSFKNGYNGTIGGGGLGSGENSPNWKRPKSKETRKKLSDNHADVSGKNNPNFGKHPVCPHKGKFGKDNNISKTWKIYRTTNKIDITDNAREWCE